MSDQPKDLRELVEEGQVESVTLFALSLRAACIHGRYDAHTFLANPDFPESSIAYRDCPGGREVADDMEKMWVCLFDGPNDLCEQGKMTSKHQELCGEFWLLPVDAVLGDTK